MPADVTELQIVVRSKDVDVATKRLKRLEVQGRRTERRTEKVTNSFGKLAVKLGLAGAAAAVLFKTFDNRRTLERLNSQLITATGSAIGADIAFSELTKTANQMAFSLIETTDAFIRLKNLGLDPSEEALISYGNTAAAMGKSLNQFIEAVADATTREFERLKEFGIRASQQGDRVRFTFRGMTTEIGNNAKEIEKFLVDLGNVEFAGAQERILETIDGQLSIIGDKLFQISNLGFEAAFGGATAKTLEVLSVQLGKIAEQQLIEKTQERLFKVTGFENGRLAILEKGDFTIADIDALQTVVDNQEFLGKLRGQSLVAAQDLLGHLKLEAIMVRQIKEANEERVKVDETRAGQQELAEKRRIRELSDTDKLFLKRLELKVLEDELAKGEASSVEASIRRILQIDLEIEKLEELAKKEKFGFDKRLQNAIDFTDSLVLIRQGSNEKLFRLQKGLALSQALIEIPSAASSAYANEPGGVIAKSIAAAIAVAAQTARAEAIRSTTFAGNFAGGGVVGGSSFSGDSQRANVNSGEMILNRMQQANLFKVAQGGGGGGGGPKIIINNFGTESTVQQTQDSNGQEILEITNRVSQAVKSDINRDIQQGDGPTSRALKVAFGRMR